MLRHFKIVFLLALIPAAGISQNIDSLEKVANSSGEIKSRVAAMQALSTYYLRTDTTKSKFYALRGISESTANNFVKGIIVSNESLARYYIENGKYDSAIVILSHVLEKHNLAEHQNEIAAVYVTLGNTYDMIANYDDALKSYMEAEKIYQSLNNIKGLGLSQMGIGNIFAETNQHIDAKKYYRKSYKNLLHGNELSASWSMNNLASSMTALGEFDSAIYFFEKSLEMKLRLNDVYGASFTYSDLGSLYYELKQTDKALDYLLKGLNLKEKLEGISKETISSSSISIGNIYFNQKNYLSAHFYFTKGLEAAKQSESLVNQTSAYKWLAYTEEKMGNYKEALNLLKQHLIFNDSLNNQRNNESIANMRQKYDADQKEKEIELLNSTNKVSQLETERANKVTETVTFYLIAAVVIIILATFLGISLFRSNAAKKKVNDLLVLKNNEIHTQKEIVEEKNKEILDSISYAKRIQNAILPPLPLIQKALPNSFLLYKPKDIVAGDFYWFEEIDGFKFIAAADCTGHGVPGAMVSVVCSNALNRTVKEFGLRDPGEILDKVRILVVETFEKSEEDVKDGMDISLCRIDTEKKLLKWAGANNPLWYIPNSNKNELIELKANKQPIGKHSNAIPFTSHEIVLSKQDSFYIFTDGFADQFGGQKGKKFKSSSLKELILSVQNKEMNSQMEDLNRCFENWKSGFEQVDDVCIIGIRI